MLISDPKGELYEYTYPYLSRLGYDVVTIDYKNPLKSNCYNYLLPIVQAVKEKDTAKAVTLT